MNRQRLYLIGAAWLMLVLLIGCVPATNDVEMEAEVADSEGTATAVAAITTTPTTEESEMNDDETPTPETDLPLELNTPVPKKLTPQVPPPRFSEGSGDKPTIPAPENPTAQEWIEAAKNDLAGRLGVEAALIGLVEYQSVTWRDGSLGCPQPGMAYTQALVEGYRIQLQIDGVQYDYHGADGRDPFYCPGPGQKFDGTVPPAPGQRGTD